MSSEGRPDPGPLIDTATLAANLGLEAGAAGFVAELIAIFEAHSAGQVTSLDAAVAAGRWVEVRELAHGLKGASAAIGGAALSVVAARLEAAAAAGDRGAVREAHAQLAPLRTRTLEALRAWQATLR